MNRSILALTALLAMTPFAARADEWVFDPAGTLANPDVLKQGDRFGGTLAAAGDWLFVGAPYDRIPGGPTYNGAVHVFARNGTDQWVSVTRLQSPQPADSVFFGAAIAALDTRLAIGARGEDQGQGAVHIYESDMNGGWLPPLRVVDNPRINNSRFGFSVALDGDWLFVGVGSYPGFVHRFERQGDGSWLKTGTATPSNGSGDHGFGTCIAARGGRLFVGSIGNAGALYVFDAQAQAMPQLARIVLADPGASDQFGCGLAAAADGSRIAVGAKSRNNFVGEVEIYRAPVGAPAPNEVWTLEAALQPPAGQTVANGYFGASVIMSQDGERAIIGAPVNLSNPGVPTSGKAYVFAHATENIWTLEATLTQPNDPGNSPAGFGLTLALSADENYLFASAPFADAGAETQAGIVYRFSRISYLFSNGFEAP